MQILEGYAEFESFAYIARDFESAAEATSLLSSVASLTISKALRLVLRKFSSAEDETQ